MRPLALQAIAAIALLLTAACGGRGGGGSPTEVAPEQPSTPSDSTARPPPDPSREALTRTTSKGQTAARVVDYLRWQVSGGPWEGSGGTYSHDPGLVRYTSAPTVHLAPGMTAREFGIVHYGIALVNRALPYGQHLRIGLAAPSVVARDGGDLQGKVPDGQIFVEYHRNSASGRASPGVAHQDVTHAYDDAQQRWEKKALRAAQIEMDSDFFDGRPEYQAVATFVHELLHSLGLQGHPGGEDFPDSNMYDAWFRLDGSLPAIDAAGILALYARLPAATEPEELSITSLGAWEDQTTDLTRSLSSVSFGVRHANDVTMPWTSGREPARVLAANSRLRGTATWEGDLIGFTPALVGVQGDAEISVTLATMQGRADFTGLKNEDGSTWGDGNLGYTITVGANYLRSTGGDAGTVNGQFYGSNHEGVGGSIERADLTAAFGARRQ